MNRSKNRALISDINVVPYIDVMLVLLVIFMITAPLLSQGVIIDLPDVPADPLDAALNDPLVLSVDSEGRFYLNFGGDSETALDESAVLERVGAVLREDTGVSMFVRGDEGATHGRVMQGFALLKRAGANQVVLMTEFPDVESD
jgi:biopolymer transport protein TolR